MKLTLSALTVFVAVVGVMSLLLLVLAIGTDFWYIIDASKWESSVNSSIFLSSHSGLWTTCNCKCFNLIFCALLLTLQLSITRFFII